MEEATTQNLSPTQEVGSDIAKCLEELDSYIIKQGEAFGRMYSCIAHPEVLDLEVKEVIQCVRIKIWEMLQKRHSIVHYKSYIKQMICHTFIDAMRRQKKCWLPLIVDEYGEVEGKTVYPQSSYASDPAFIVEQRIEVETLVDSVVEAIVHLPKRQQQAMVCFLRERVDDLDQVDQLFREYKLDVETITWPLLAAEKQLLKASISPAREGIKKYLGSRITVPDAMCVPLGTKTL